MKVFHKVVFRILFLLIFLIFLGIFLPNRLYENKNLNEKLSIPPINSSTSGNSISFMNNDDVDTFCSGNISDGMSFENAYVIEGLELNITEDIGISVMNIDRYIIFKDLKLYNFAEIRGSIGLLISNSS